MSLRIKSVLLKDFDKKDIRPFTPYKEGVEIQWQKSENKNETYASIVANNKQEINNQLSLLSNKISSERCRTLNNLPKYRIINTTVKRVY